MIDGRFFSSSVAITLLCNSKLKNGGAQNGMFSIYSEKERCSPVTFDVCLPASPLLLPMNE